MQEFPVVSASRPSPNLSGTPADAHVFAEKTQRPCERRSIGGGQKETQQATVIREPWALAVCTGKTREVGKNRTTSITAFVAFHQRVGRIKKTIVRNGSGSLGPFITSVVCTAISSPPLRRPPPDRKTEINGPSNGPGRGLNVTAIKGVNMKLAAGRTTETDCVCER